MAGITLPEFVYKWSASKRTERAGSQEHFINLCQLLDQPTPNSDPTGESYAFEKGAIKTTGDDGFADVWKRGYFAWEYKGKHKDLKAAYQQLLQYREDLDNPPLLIVCDLDRFEVHTNFTATAKRVYAFDLADLQKTVATPTCPLPPLEVLRAVFQHPSSLRPQQTTEQVTEQAAAEFAKLAESLRGRGLDPERSAHFLMRLLFCLFSEDIGLLPSGIFGRIVAATQARPAEFIPRLRQLFNAMATGGSFGADDIAHFNGGLFADDDALDLTREDLEVLNGAAQLDWASIEPAIFGTLFERSLDPSKRAQLGAHYTSRDDILLVVEPVLMAPLRKRWVAIQVEAEGLVIRRDGSFGATRTRYQQSLENLLRGFAEEIAAIRVLDPACGSGNFLYVALKLLLDLEKEVVTFAVTHGLTAFFPSVGPEQLYGIEINAYAHELAQIVVWIGYIQWLHDNGFGVPSSPILKPLHNIEERDAILAYGNNGQLIEPEWPKAAVIIGNPPFLGGKLLRRGLGDEYVDNLFRLYDGRVPREADLVTYWFERARALIANGQVRRAGLLATQGIRGGANRRVLERIKESGDIFMAWSDREWILDGAAVHVSLIGFDDGSEITRTVDGIHVGSINTALSGAIDLAGAERLRENSGLGFMGVTPGGTFDVEAEVAEQWLSVMNNPNGRPNSDVLRPYWNGIDLVRRPRGRWIVDFGIDRTEGSAALYEAPFAHVVQTVRPFRLTSRTTRSEWWLHERPRVDMRKALAPLRRFIGTSMVAKHRIFTWVPPEVLPANLMIVIARDDDYFLGVLHSRLHLLWARQMGTQLREAESGQRYTPTTTFETYPFPWPPGSEPLADPLVDRIATAAQALVAQRDLWLNAPAATEEEKLQRTLTHLYNQMPTWLHMAHRRLDEAVLGAYGWSSDLTDDGLLQNLLILNKDRASSDLHTVPLL